MNLEYFTGRQGELQTLNDLTQRRMASLVVIKGRRRIGKTRLVEEFAKDKPFLRFAGLPPTAGVDAQVQRDEFARLLSEQTSLPEIKTDDWSKLFALLAEKVQQGLQVILLDEITWMAEGDPTFLSKLKNAWELYFKQNPKLIMILCGSVSAWIEKNILSSTGYFGRISRKITLNELPLLACNQLLQAIGFQRSAYEKFLILSLTGGIPWYIESINPNEAAVQNIQSLCFDSDGLLVDEHRHIFHDLFGRRSAVYEKITHFLAKQTAEYGAIAKGINYQSSGQLSDYLHELIDAGYVSTHPAWNFKTGKERQVVLYRLADNYLRFYYKYIQPNLSAIGRDQYVNRDLASLPAWNSLMGFQFETLVLNNRQLIQRALRIAPEDIVIDNIYYQRATKAMPGCQIDYLIQTRTGNLFVCEIKFSKHEVGLSVVHEMQEKIAKLAVPQRMTCVPVLIHVNGVASSVETAEYFYKIIDFSEFLSKDSR